MEYVFKNVMLNIIIIIGTLTDLSVLIFPTALSVYNYAVIIKLTNTVNHNACIQI